MAQLKHIHVLSRAGQADVLLGFATSDSGTDNLLQWVATGWAIILALPGTDLIYDSVTWRERLYWVDGKNAIGVYDGQGFCILPPEAPVGQYIRVHQDRLCVGGDARNQAEVEADGELWPVDSNRNRVIYCEVLDDATWSPNNFIDTTTIDGEIISGLEIGGTTTSVEGAQSVLAIFKPTNTMLHQGPLGTANVQLNIVSSDQGCPGYHSMGRTHKGIVFATTTTVAVLEPASNAEPTEIGFAISPAIQAIPSAMQKWTAGFFHEDKYHLAYSNSSVVENELELELDMRDPVFPGEQNWYGPHTGDAILQWAVYNSQLVAAEFGTLNMWRVDVEGQFDSMSSEIPRVARIVLPMISTPNLTEGKLDAFGFRAQMAASGIMGFEIGYDRNTDTEVNSWTAPSTIGSFGPAYPVVRPTKQPAHDVQITMNYGEDSDLQIDTVYLRARLRRRQSEKQSGSTQE